MQGKYFVCDVRRISPHAVFVGMPRLGVATLLLLLVAATIPALANDVLTYHNDLSRTGQNLNETILTTSNVNSAGFGLLFTMKVDSNIDAQPLYVSGVTIGGVSRNVVYTVTENDSVYAFDADTGTKLWKVSAKMTGEIAPSGKTINCNQIGPTLGITATPVIDRSSGPHGAIYFVAMSADTLGNYYQRLHALDLTTGAEEFGGPTTIAAQYAGSGAGSLNGTLTFDPKQYAARAGLLLLNGVIFMGWTSHWHIHPYTGRLT